MFVCLCRRQTTTLWLITLAVCVWSSTMTSSWEESWKNEQELRRMRVCILVFERPCDLICAFVVSYLLICLSLRSHRGLRGSVQPSWFYCCDTQRLERRCHAKRTKKSGLKKFFEWWCLGKQCHTSPELYHQWQARHILYILIIVLPNVSSLKVRSTWVSVINCDGWHTKSHIETVF